MNDKINAIRIKNFLSLIKKEFNGSMYAFAKKFNVSPTSYYMIVKGNRSFGSQAAKTVEKLFNLQPGQLDKKYGNMEYELSFDIPIFSNNLTSNDGQTIFEQEVIRYYVLDGNDVKAHGWNEKALCIFQVQGDEMYPELRNGHKVIVDTSQAEIIDNRIYVISVNNKIVLKRMFKELGTDKLIARSSNRAYPDRDFYKENDLKIIGRVVYLMGEVL